MAGDENEWVRVPRKATREMLNAAVDVDALKLGDISPLGFRISLQLLFEQCYAAMLAAAPTPEAGREDAVVVLENARKQLPRKIESTEFGDLNIEELGIFDNGYNAALLRCHNLLNMDVALIRKAIARGNGGNSD